MQIVQSAGARMAFPAQTMYVATDADKQEARSPVGLKTWRERKESKENAAAKSA